MTSTIGALLILTGFISLYRAGKAKVTPPRKQGEHHGQVVRARRTPDGHRLHLPHLERLN